MKTHDVLEAAVADLQFIKNLFYLKTNPSTIQERKKKLSSSHIRRIKLRKSKIEQNRAVKIS